VPSVPPCEKYQWDSVWSITTPDISVHRPAVNGDTVVRGISVACGAHNKSNHRAAVNGDTVVRGRTINPGAANVVGVHLTPVDGDGIVRGNARWCRHPHRKPVHYPPFRH